VRIAVVCPYSLSSPGGVQSQALGLADAYRARGNDVLIVAPFDDDALELVTGEYPDLEIASAGRSVRIAVNGSVAPVALSPVATIGANWTVARFAPDVVHLHEPFVPGIGPTLLARSEAPVLGTFHRAGASAVYRGARRLAVAGFRRLADAVAVSAAARATLVEVVGPAASGIELIANGVALDRFEGIEPAEACRPTIVFVGRLEPRKGLAILLEAFSSLEGDLSCWVVGDGAEGPPLRRRFASDRRIEWIGAGNDAEVARRLAGATLFAAPSLSGESFGVVLLEAMAAGTAVIASDIPGYHLAGGEAVRYVRPGDAPALAAAIGSLLADRNARDELVARGRARATSFSFTTVADAYLARFAAVIERSIDRPRHGDDVELS